MKDKMEDIFRQYLKLHNHTNFDIKAILFDMDGVLYDSMKYHARSWHETMTEYGFETTPEEFYLYEGMVGPNTIRHIVKREENRDAEEAEVKEIYERKTSLFSEYNKGDLIPCAYEFVKQVSREGYVSVLVTGSGQPTLIDKLDASFDGVFKKDRMVTAFDVKYGKPHPEPYLIGLKKGGDLQPNQAIVIENAPRGVESASAAGIFTIAVNTGPLDEKVLSDAGANLVFPSMQALYEQWDEIRRLLKEQEGRK